MNIEPLSYEDDIEIEEAEARLQEARECFQSVRGHYNRKWPRFGRRKQLTQDDLRTLGDLTGVLLPLGLQRSVQEQFRSAQGSSDSVLVKTSDLLREILFFSAEFENSGVTLLGVFPT